MPVSRKILVLVLALALAGAAAFSGCGGAAASWRVMGPKQKAAVMWDIYSGQYERYLADYDRWKTAADGPARNALRESLKARKQALREAYDALTIYSGYVDTGAVPLPAVEDKALDLLGRIGG